MSTRSASADGSDSRGGDLPEEDRRYRQALDRAVQLLARREHSVRELVEKLVSKGIDGATARLVVDDLRGRGLQSDRRFAEVLVRSRVERGHGPVRIRQELSQRGIEDELVREMLSDGADRWRLRASAVRERKFGSCAPADRKHWSRQARFLAARGFPADLVYQVLGDLSD